MPRAATHAATRGSIKPSPHPVTQEAPPRHRRHVGRDRERSTAAAAAASWHDGMRCSSSHGGPCNSAYTLQPYKVQQIPLLPQRA
jgi:hypothetical protein